MDPETDRLPSSRKPYNTLTKTASIVIFTTKRHLHNRYHHCRLTALHHRHILHLNGQRSTLSPHTAFDPTPLADSVSSSHKSKVCIQKQ
ncbi:hypothetical protein L2E82_13531 [Cichorium intybus]|uniref:Uncharacterized protein n=1 Tax=Cichorium intybus TaxID=13427 RepID=A0ACB9EY10_CICIN|nr:hypothetical protein L2E82_13531 [Cichorium intybus]